VGYVQLTCATVFFLCMAYYPFSVFTRTNSKILPTPQKRKRNVVYWVCGLAIVTCLVLVVVTNLVVTYHVKGELHPVFWLESVAVWASVAW
jgi:hypothetical protein